MPIEFSDFWAQLPQGMKKGDKVRAKVRFDRLAASGCLLALQNALQFYCAELRRDTWKQPMYLSTWLGSATNERWREWDHPSIPIEKLVVDDEWVRHRAEVIQRDREKQKLPYLSVDDIIKRLAETEA